MATINFLQTVFPSWLGCCLWSDDAGNEWTWWPCAEQLAFYVIQVSKKRMTFCCFSSISSGLEINEHQNNELISKLLWCCSYSWPFLQVSCSTWMGLTWASWWSSGGHKSKRQREIKAWLLHQNSQEMDHSYLPSTVQLPFNWITRHYFLLLQIFYWYFIFIPH